MTKFPKSRLKSKHGVRFYRGGLPRARRDVLARRLAKSKHVKSPYGLATYMVKRGAHVRNDEVARELAEQLAAKRKQTN